MALQRADMFCEKVHAQRCCHLNPIRTIHVWDRYTIFLLVVLIYYNFSELDNDVNVVHLGQRLHSVSRTLTNNQQQYLDDRATIGSSMFFNNKTTRTNERMNECIAGLATTTIISNGHDFCCLFEIVAFTRQ